MRRRILVLIGVLVWVAPPLGALSGGHGERQFDSAFDSAAVDLGANTGWLDHRGEGAGAIADGSLRALAGRAAQGLPLGAESLVSGGRVLVDIRHDMNDAGIEGVLAGLGATVYRYLGGGVVEAFVPIERLAELEEVPGVASASPPPRLLLLQAGAGNGQAVLPLVTTVTGEEVAKTRADEWQAGGNDGTGVKIGVIDVFDLAIWGDAEAASEVPAPTGVICRDNGFPCDIWTAAPGESHGTAVAEILHELVPGAQIYLGTAVTPGDYLNVLDFFAAQGVDVVSHSATWEYDGPGDGTGPAGSVIDYAAALGMAWINSAGNFAGGGYWRGGWADANANNFIDFSSGNDILQFFCGPALGVRWDDWIDLNPTDYDVYIWENPADVGTNNFKAFSIDDQTAGAPPMEHFTDDLLNSGCAGPGDVDFLAIHMFAPGDGNVGDTLELGLATALQFPSDPFSAAIPFGDSANPASLSVGAVDPPLELNAASYSSRGPTNDNRIKPDLVAASGVSNFTFGAFHGTSASAPTVAGVAALVLDAGLAASAVDLVNFLKSVAVDRGTPGTDNTFGVGELILSDPPNHAPVAVDDGYVTDEDTVLSVVAGSGVLANDTDVDLDPLSVSASDSASTQGGVVAVAADGSFSYTPPPNFAGVDTFGYTVSDGLVTDVGVVTITVTAVNEPPVAVNDSYAASKDTPLSVVAGSGVLVNDTDVDLDPLSVSASDSASTQGGVVAVAANGSFSYTPPSGFVGSDTFTYTVSDGALADTATVTINVTVPSSGGGGGGGIPPAEACPTTIPSAGFTDLAGLSQEAIHAINCLADYGISTGTTASTFSPNVTIPRWQMALFLVRQAGVHGVALPTPVDQGFTDIGSFDQATRDAINRLASLGITTGTSPTTFSPNGHVSRWQMAIFLVRLSIRVGIPVPTVPPDAGFVDISDLNDPTQVAINALAIIDITKGTSATEFSPNLAVTRWQMAIFLTRVLQVGGIVPT
jgi:hypothetical protein